jgi:hypothetical protein
VWEESGQEDGVGERMQKRGHGRRSVSRRGEELGSDLLGRMVIVFGAVGQAGEIVGEPDVWRLGVMGVASTVGGGEGGKEYGTGRRRSGKVMSKER